jgi:hypothetical protein
MVRNMVDSKVILIQLWLGTIPDYFWHHYETTKNLKNVDFLLLTNDDISIESKNYRIVKIPSHWIEEKVSSMLECDYKITNFKKINDLKSSYGELFEDYIEGYDYFGFYDIDTLFGDLNKWIFPHIPEYDVVSFADSVFHNRLGGPLTVIRNTYEFRRLYRKEIERFKETLNHDSIDAFEEHELTRIFNQHCRVKLIYDSINCETNNGGKNTYDGFWSGGQIFVSGEEKLLYHFYRKDQTSFTKIGNSISVNFKKPLVDDFYWVVSFTKNYEDLFLNLMGSIKKYSNRRCVIYSINYDFVPRSHDLGNNQFIYRRIDIPEGEKDSRGRDINIITSKPLVNIDVINSFPGMKFINIDSDIYLTVNSDSISKYFSDLDNYPLINSHIHDVIYLSGINPEEEWTSSLHVLANEMGVNNEIFPRRKTNVVLFDERSEWFFKEQMDLYSNYKGKSPGILALHDEDTANALIWKYNLKKCLPLVDAEEVDTIDMEKFHNYSYSMTVNISPSVSMPKNINEVFFFHGIKSQDHFDRIVNSYGNEVVDAEEFVISYKDRNLFFEKNSFLTTKKIGDRVDFIVSDLNDNNFLSLSDQPIFNYWIFYISDVDLKKGKYKIKIAESETKRIFFSSVFDVF